MVRRATEQGHKLQFKWEGPRRILSTNSELVFKAKSLSSMTRETMHASRFQLHRADGDCKNVDPTLLSVAAHTETTYQDASLLRYIRLKDRTIEIQVEWEGLLDHVDFTWEPLQNVHEDIPETLHAFLLPAETGALKNKHKKQTNPLESQRGL